VGLGRSRRDAETVGDLLIGTSGGDQLDHLALPIRNDRPALVQYSDHVGEANKGRARCLFAGGRNFGITPCGVAAAPFRFALHPRTLQPCLSARAVAKRTRQVHVLQRLRRPLHKARSAAREGHKVVTVVFADLSAS
jgi:hypothetical protein